MYTNHLGSFYRADRGSDLTGLGWSLGTGIFNSSLGNLRAAARAEDHHNSPGLTLQMGQLMLALLHP